MTTTVLRIDLAAKMPHLPVQRQKNAQKIREFAEIYPILDPCTYDILYLPTFTVNIHQI